jgi:hypothetical protein
MSPHPMTFGVVAVCRPVGVVRTGFAAAACRLCGAARYEDELADAHEAVDWLKRHLGEAHGEHRALTVQPRTDGRNGTCRLRGAEVEALLRRAA